MSMMKSTTKCRPASHTWALWRGTRPRQTGRYGLSLMIWIEAPQKVIYKLFKLFSEVWASSFFVQIFAVNLCSKVWASKLFVEILLLIYVVRFEPLSFLQKLNIISSHIISFAFFFTYSQSTLLVCSRPLRWRKKRRRDVLREKYIDHTFFYLL